MSFQNPKWPKPAPDLGFRADFGAFFENLEFPGAGCCWHSVGTCRVCLQSIWSCFECMLQVLLLKIEIISKNRLRNTSLKVSSAKGKRRPDYAKSSFRALGPGWLFRDTANTFQCVCGCIWLVSGVHSSTCRGLCCWKSKIIGNFSGRRLHSRFGPA